MPLRRARLAAAAPRGGEVMPPLESRRTRRMCGPRGPLWGPVVGPGRARGAPLETGEALAAFTLILTAMMGGRPPQWTESCARAREWRRIVVEETLGRAARAVEWGRPGAFRQAGPAFPVILGVRASEGYAEACITS
ncbi:hypothetical protein NDU88_002654 [Pleurodeles waltl]|uniref:Uncharacterized protein n=1 Tax=Pleurodeles waltl TaxID=8319 RepID=A0AAV7UXZ9_PLEWA|nr:hypothetical protein NDU88_002654 [Pleurodeles waltl]